MSIPLIFECNPSPFPVYDVEAEAVEVAEVVAPDGASSSMSSVSRFRGMGSRGKRNPSHAFIGSRKGFRPSYFGVFGALPGSPCQLSAVGPTACPFSHIGESEGKKETARLHGRFLWSRLRDAISSHRSRSICSRHMSGSRSGRRRGFPLGPSLFRRRALRGSALGCSHCLARQLAGVL